MAGAFYGREKEIQQVLSRLLKSNHKFLVIYGQTHVGATAFLKQGILPTLQERNLAVKYFNLQDLEGLPESEESAAERKNRLPFLEDIGKDESGERSAESPFEIILLDDFSEIFSLQAAEAEPIIQGIRKGLESTQRNVRFVLTLHQEQFHNLFSLMSQLPGIADNVFDLKGLSYNDAREGVLDEARERNVALPEAVLSGFLDELASPQVSPNGISPLFLRLLIEELFDGEAWKSYKNLDQLISSYLKRVYEAFGHERRIAEDILQEIALQTRQRSPLNLQSLAPRIGTTIEIIRRILHSLCDEFMLLDRCGRRRYEISHPFMTQHILAQLEPTLKKAEESLAMLKRAYENWQLSDRLSDSLMDKTEFQHLERYREYLMLPEEIIQFVVFTALYRETQTEFKGTGEYWLKRFADPEKEESILFDVYYDQSINLHMRQNAIRLLHLYESERVASDLIQLVLEEPLGELRSALISVLRQMDAEKLRPILQPLIQQHIENPASEYRATAISLLPLFSPDIALNLARKILRSKNPTSLKIAVIQTMGKLEPVRTVDSLLQACLAADEETVRIEAARVLGQISKPALAERYIDRLSEKIKNFNTAYEAVRRSPSLATQVGNGILILSYFLIGWIFHGLAHAFLRRYKTALFIFCVEIFCGLALVILTIHSEFPISFIPLFFLLGTLLYDIIGAYFIVERSISQNHAITGDSFRGIAIRSVFVIIPGLLIHGTYHFAIKRRILAGILFAFELAGFALLFLNTNYGAIAFAVCFVATFIIDAIGAYIASVWQLDRNLQPVSRRIRAISPIFAILFGAGFLIHGALNLSIKNYKRAAIIFLLELLSLAMLFIGVNLTWLAVLSSLLFWFTYLYDIISSFNKIRLNLDRQLIETEPVAGSSAVLMYPLLLSLGLHGIVHLYIGKWRHALALFAIELIGIFSFIFQDFVLLSFQAVWLSAFLFIATFLYDVILGYLRLQRGCENEAESRLTNAYGQIKSPALCDILLRRFNERDLSILTILKASSSEYIAKEMIRILTDSQSAMRRKAAQIIEFMRVKNETIFAGLKSELFRSREPWLIDTLIKIFVNRKIYAAVDSLKEAERKTKGLTRFKISLATLNLQIPPYIKYIFYVVIILLPLSLGFQINRLTDPTHDVEGLINLMHNRYADSPETQRGFLNILGEIAKNPNPPAWHVSELQQILVLKEGALPYLNVSEKLESIFKPGRENGQPAGISPDTLLLALRWIKMKPEDSRVKIIRRIDSEFREIIADPELDILVRRSAISNWIELLNLVEKLDLRPLDAMPTFAVLQHCLGDFHENQAFQRFIVREVGKVDNEEIMKMMLDLSEQRIKADPAIQYEALLQIISRGSPQMIRTILNFALGNVGLSTYQQLPSVPFAQSGFKRYQHLRENGSSDTDISKQAENRLAHLTNEQAIDSLLTIVNDYRLRYTYPAHRKIMGDILVENGNYQYGRKNFESAVRIFSLVEKLAPYRMDVIESLGYASYQLKDTNRRYLAIAIDKMKTLSRYETNDALLFSRLGECYADSGLLKLAEQEFLKAIRIDPSNYSLTFLAEISRRQNNFIRALGYVRRAFQVDSSAAWTYAVSGNTHYDMKNYEQAQANLLKAIALSPTYDWAYSKLRNSYHSMGQNHRAIDEFTRLSTQPENRPYALRQLAFIYHEYTFDFKRAYLIKSDLEKMFPDDITIRADLVENAFTIGKNQEVLTRARALFNDAAISSQHRVILLFFKTCALILMDSEESALSEAKNFEQALQALPEDYRRSWRFDGTRYFIEHRVRNRQKQQKMLDLLSELESTPESAY
ncbi:HEAT repeat domain-containing protein [candidate division KSB1 bacterium]|nr:HEAT repeat domain-containing protein [candidate division KSB1 bacterium]